MRGKPRSTQSDNPFQNYLTEEEKAGATPAFFAFPAARHHNVRTAWGFLAVRLPEKDDEWMGYRAKILQGLGVLDAERDPTERLDVVVAGDVARLTAEEWQTERGRMINVYP